MYELTCPSCSSQVGSLFIRHGAVVRCGDCAHRYRIKSSYVTRTVMTGPKTLDELDPLLRGDSVDLDQVEVARDGEDAAPVSLDDDGNVVGLSGLSELMRQSDAAHAQAAAIARTRAEDNTPPPTARLARPSAPGASAASTRARRSKTKRKNNSAMLGLLVAAVALLMVGTIAGVAYIVMQPDAPKPITQTQTPNNTDPAASLGNPATNPNANPDTQSHNPSNPDPSGGNEGTDAGNGDDPEGTVDWLMSAGGPQDNPDYRFNPNAVHGDAPRPIDVPTVLTLAQPMIHEGWYITTPPREGVAATGASDVELGRLESVTEDNTRVVLSGTLTHHGTEIAVSGEAHVALLDSSGRVFAETYVPFAMLRPGEPQEVRLSVPTRHWHRARDVRTQTTVLEKADEVLALGDVAVQPSGDGAWSSLRITMRNPHDRWLRDALVLIWAEDVAGRTVARFRAVEEDIYVGPSGWLDIVVLVPLDKDTGPVSWHATVLER